MNTSLLSIPTAIHPQMLCVHILVHINSDIPVFEIILLLVFIKFGLNYLRFSFYLVFIIFLFQFVYTFSQIISVNFFYSIFVISVFSQHIFLHHCSLAPIYHLLYSRMTLTPTGCHGPTQSTWPRTPTTLETVGNQWRYALIVVQAGEEEEVKYPFTALTLLIG